MWCCVYMINNWAAYVMQARACVVRKDGANKGRRFYSCSASGADRCTFFKVLFENLSDVLARGPFHFHPLQWADEGCGAETGEDMARSAASTPEAVESVFVARGCLLYCECELSKRAPGQGTLAPRISAHWSFMGY